MTLLRRGDTSPFDERIVWMFGSPRSGSTWLLWLLAEHERVVPINEPLIGWYLGPFMSDLPGMDARRFGPEDFTLRRRHRDKPMSFFAEPFADVWLPGLARLLRDRFRAHARRHPPAAGFRRCLVVVKEPSGSQSADVLLRALPRSRLLFLLRDGRDVVDSELAANLRGAWVSEQFSAGDTGIGEDERLAFVVQSARKWLWRTEVVQEAFARHSGDKLLLRYEDLRGDPVPQLATLMGWLGLDAGEERLRTMVAKHAFEALPAEQRGADRFYRSATPGAWRENLRPEEQAVLEAELGPKLTELGYART